MSYEVDEDTRSEVRTYWHSDHYRNQVGNGLVGPIWDVLADNPAGITVPAIALRLIDDRRVRAGQSWFLSFGAEQRHRPGMQFHERYRNLDPDSTDSYTWTWDADDRFYYALMERVHWNIRTMVKHGYAVTSGPAVVQNLQLSYHRKIAGRTGGVPQGHLPGYTAGEPPLVTAINPRCECGKYHHDTYKRRWVRGEGLGPDPDVLRDSWVSEVRAALSKDRLPTARQLLERGLQVMTAT